jgi:hypothetical protein
MHNALMAFLLLMLASCSAEDKQEILASAPKQIKLDIHLPIPVEPWPLPDD